MHAAPKRKCRVCGTLNAARQGYCEGCGALLERHPVESRTQAVVSGIMVGTTIALFAYLGGCDSTQTTHDQLVAAVEIGSLVAAILAWRAWPDGTPLERRVHSPIDAITSGVVVWALAIAFMLLPTVLFSLYGWDSAYTLRGELPSIIAVGGIIAVIWTWRHGKATRNGNP